MDRQCTHHAHSFVRKLGQQPRKDGSWRERKQLVLLDRCPCNAVVSYTDGNGATQHRCLAHLPAHERAVREARERLKVERQRVVLTGAHCPGPITSPATRDWLI